MSKSHVVKLGEHIPRLADAFGFKDKSAIWDHPSNAELKQNRVPCILNPGDTVFIPDVTPKKLEVATGQQHSFVLKRIRVRLRLTLKDASNRSIANVPCELKCKSEVFLLETDGEGTIDQEIQVDTELCKLTFLETEVQVRVGHLTPIDTGSGVRARLNNLGYLAGVGCGDDEDEDVELRSALEEFQCDNRLDLTGTVDQATRDKLLAIHGL